MQLQPPTSHPTTDLTIDGTDTPDALDGSAGPSGMVHALAREDVGPARRVARLASTTGNRSDGTQADGLGLLDEHALRQLLSTQPVIEQAKGLLMGHYRLDPDQAFAVLRRWSSSSHVKVRELAAQLVEAASRPDPHPFDPSTFTST